MKNKTLILSILFILLLVSIKTPVFANIDDYMTKAEEYLDKGENDRAMDEYKKALAEEPDNAMVLLQIGNICLNKGDLDQAIQYYQKSIQLNQSSYSAHFNLARAYKEKGDLTSALAEYEKSIALSPHDPTAYINRGNIYAEEGNTDLAGKDYDHAILLYPKSPDAHYYRGKLYLSLYETTKNDKDLDLAMADFKLVTEIIPDYRGAHFSLGKIYFYRKDLETAASEFNTEIEATKLSTAYHFLGKIYFQKGDPTKALEQYKMAQSADPKGTDLNIEDYNSDVIKAQQAISGQNTPTPAPTPAPTKNTQVTTPTPVPTTNTQVTPTTPAPTKNSQDNTSKNQEAVIHFNKGSELYSQGDLDGAMKEYLSAVTIDPTYARAYYNLGLTCEMKGQLDQAIEDYSKAISINADYQNALYAIGMAYKKKSEKSPEPTKPLLKVIEYLSVYQGLIHPDTMNYQMAKDAIVEAHYNLGRYYKEKGDKAKALEHFQACLALLEQNDTRINSLKTQIEELKK